MNYWKITLIALGTVLLGGACSEEEDMESTIFTDQEEETTVAVARDLAQVNCELFNLSQIVLPLLNTVNQLSGSINPDAAQVGNRLRQVTIPLAAVYDAARVPANATVANTAVAGSPEAVAVYNYQAYTWNPDDGESTAYYALQVSQADGKFIYDLFSGASENPTDLLVHAELNDDLRTATLSTALDETYELSLAPQDEEGATRIVSTDAAGMPLTVTVQGDNSGSYTYAGEVSNAATWGAESITGTLNGRSWHYGYVELDLLPIYRSALQIQENMVSAGDGGGWAGSRLDFFTNPLENSAAFLNPPADAVVSSTPVTGELPSSVLSWTTDDGEEVEYQFSLDDTKYYHDVFVTIDGEQQLLIDAEQNQDGSTSSLVEAPGVENAGYDFEYRVAKSNVADSTQLLLEVPTPWQGSLLLEQYTMTYLPAEGTPGTYVWNRSFTEFGETLWFESDWQANGTSGTYNQYTWDGSITNAWFWGQ